MKNTQTFTLTAMFLAILLLFASVPFLGFIPIGPLNATTLHIPVILASIVLGPKIGGSLGAVFGIISVIRNTIIVSPLSFAFSPFVPVFGADHGSPLALIVAIVPRILIGVIPYFVYKWFETKKINNTFSLFVSGFLGSIVNTILVMGLIYIFFKEPYANLLDINPTAVYSAILGIIFTTGIAEAVVAALAAMTVGAVLLRLLKKNKTHL